ncbi:MAG TPA: DUF1493 family protein [Myxococcales bacterium]|jgi:hypothetical protein
MPLDSAEIQARLEAVIEFVARECSVSSGRLTGTTRLTADLGVTGDDALQLMASFAKEFGVDLSRFRPEQHFAAEAMNPLLLFSRRWWRSRRTLRDVTLVELADAASRRKW